MIYITTLQSNDLTLNINNNAREPFPVDGKIYISSEHILSATVGETVELTAGTPEFQYNERYTDILLSQSVSRSLFPNYDGEWKIVIRNYDNFVLYRGMVIVSGNNLVESEPFIEYESDNENNESYIYIEE